MKKNSFEKFQNQQNGNIFLTRFIHQILEQRKCDQISGVTMIILDLVALKKWWVLSRQIK